MIARSADVDSVCIGVHLTRRAPIHRFFSPLTLIRLGEDNDGAILVNQRTLLDPDDAYRSIATCKIDSNYFPLILYFYLYITMRSMRKIINLLLLLRFSIKSDQPSI